MSVIVFILLLLIMIILVILIFYLNQCYPNFLPVLILKNMYKTKPSYEVQKVIHATRYNIEEYIVPLLFFFM